MARQEKVDGYIHRRQQHVVQQCILAAENWQHGSIYAEPLAITKSFKLQKILSGKEGNSAGTLKHGVETFRLIYPP